MTRFAFSRKRLLCIALTVVLAAPLLQPMTVHAQPALTATEVVRDVTLGQSYSTNTYTYPGDLLALHISITNYGNQPTTGLSVTANVHMYEDFVAGSCTAPCTFNPTAMTVTFDLSSTPLAPGMTVVLGYNVTTDMAAPAGHVHYNMATATANGVSATSNTATTTVLARGAAPCSAPYSTGCAPVSPCGVYTGCVSPCTVYTSCVSPFGFPVVCGMVTFFQPATVTTTGMVTMNGTNYVVATGTVFPFGSIIVGGTFCFVVSSSMVITGYLSTIPTAATPADNPDRIYRLGWTRVE